MSPEIVATIAIIGVLVILLASGLEIAWAIGIAAAVGLFLIGQPLYQFAPTSWASLNYFAFTAAPLFIFMGSLLGYSGVADRLFHAVDMWIGRLPGSMACSVVAANGVFAAMCGDNIAAVATFGGTAYPPMEKKGYDPGLALGSIAIGSVLTGLIPPSILLIIYGAWQSVSIVALFAAAIIPGILLLVSFILTIIIRVKLNPKLAPKPERVSWGERVAAIKEAAPFLVLIVGILGAIFGGVMTPTEAAALGAFLSIVLTLAYRRLTWARLRDSLLQSVKVSSMAFFILAMAAILTHVLNITGITFTIKEFIIGLNIGKYGVLALFFVMYFFLGMFLDSWAMLFLTFTFVMPIITALGIDLVWWGIIYVLAGDQSLVTPPYGLSLFVLHSVVPKHSIGTIVRGALPFLIPLYICILLMVIFPEIVMWLPGLLGR